MLPAAHLGVSIFNDSSLSEPAGMSCATCHQPNRAHALDDMVRFYVTRDTNPELWYPSAAGVVQKFDDPQRFQGNVNITEVPYTRKPGQAPALNDDEIDLIVEFLNTLTDGYQS